MNADLARLFQLGELAVKRHALLAKVTSVSEGENQGAVVGVPLVCVQAEELVARFDFVRRRTTGSETILEKDRPDHHGQQDDDYIGGNLDFIFRHRSLRALSKAELSSNSAALADRARAAEWNYFGGTAPKRRLRLAGRVAAALAVGTETALL